MAKDFLAGYPKGLNVDEVNDQHRVTLRMATAAMAVLAGFLALGLLSQAVYNNSHNEQMYITAGYLLAQGERLYQDFAFVQTPYSPLVYALAFRVTGGPFLATAKIVNFAFFVAAAVLTFAIARRETRDTLFSLTLLALFLANYYLLRSVIEASNYTMPMACSLGAYYLSIRYVNGSRRTALFFAAGVLLAAAVGAKLYYATLLIPFGLAALLYPRSAPLKSRVAKGLLPLAGGALVGALPLLYYATRDWDRFAFNNLGYHLLNAQWRVDNGFTATMTFSSKLDTARDLLANPSYLLVVAWLALAATVVLTQTDSTGRNVRLSASIFLAGLLAITALLTAFTPRPLFPQYFAMPIPFALALMAALYARMVQPYRRTMLQAAIISALLLTITVFPRHTGAIKAALRPDDHTAGRQAVDMSRLIRYSIETKSSIGDEPGKLLTLSPVYAIEAGLPIYRELATGSFVYRIGDLLSDEERARYHATSVSTIHDLLDADPPAAILIGDEGELETPLLEYAHSRGYVASGEEVARGQLFIR